MRRQIATGAGLTLGTTLAFGGVAHAACTCNVDSLLDPTDPGHTTLRDAITSANANPGSTITFASTLSGTISLGSDLPAINTPTTIAGPGASQLAVSGSGSHRVFYSDQSHVGDPVTISGLTVENGLANQGAGIKTNGTTMTISHAVIAGNHDTGNYGAIDGSGGGSVTVSFSTVSNNTATGSSVGAGIATESGTHTPARILDSTITGNTGARLGGGMYLDFSSPATIADSTIYRNSTAGSGGGIYDFGPYDGAPGLTVTDSTITHNAAGMNGGGIHGWGATYGSHTVTPPTVKDTIVSGNTAPNGPDVSVASVNRTPVVPGSVNAAFSLIGGLNPNTMLNSSGPNLIGADPMLGPLADNGGPTQTQKPAFNSPAVDAGNSSGLNTDQRGQGRPLEIPSIANPPGGDGADIGAVELQPADLPSNQFTATMQGKTLVASVKVSGGVTVADASSPLSAREAKKKRNRKGAPGLKRSVGSNGKPPSISVRLGLSSAAKRTLARKGKVKLNAHVTFTPQYGIPSTKTMTLTITGKRKGRHHKH
jgi:hypothetical protein